MTWRAGRWRLGGDAERERGGFAGGTADIDDIAGDFRGDGGLGDRGPGGVEVGAGGDGAQTCGAEVARAEAVRVAGEDVYLVVAGGERHRQLQQEAVELSLGEG